MRAHIIKRISALLVILLTFSASCVKDKSELLVVDAIVKNTGDPASDGCGWLLSVGPDNTYYKPENLPFEYRIDNQKVHITYRLLNTKYQCGLVPVTKDSGISNIHINAISK